MSIDSTPDVLTVVGDIPLSVRRKRGDNLRSSIEERSFSRVTEFWRNCLPEISSRVDAKSRSHYTVALQVTSDLKVQEMGMVNQELLDLLRCPVAVHYTDKGEDPGRLELVHDCWLVCADSGYKYPIVDDIPVMLVEVGEKYKDVAVKDLPVPPPSDV